MKKFVLILTLTIGLLSIPMSVNATQSTIFTNAPTYQNTPTYDGSGQAVHPSVVYFERKWHGYKYWMTMTPYPFINDKYENPSIVVSNDGQNWVVPKGLINPVIPRQPDGGRFDPNLVYDERKGCLLLYAGAGKLSVATSFNGIRWKLNNLDDFSRNLLSPSVVIKDRMYYLWGVQKNKIIPHNSADTSVIRLTSKDGLYWSDDIVNTISLPDYVIWHIEVSRYELGYKMVVAAFKAGTESPAQSTDCALSLFLATSRDGLNWNFSSTPLLNPSPDGWDNQTIYKASMLTIDRKMSLWYSAMSKQRVWHIGYTEIKRRLQ